MNIAEVFSQALAPITLISGVGLLLLSMVNRYSHITSKARSLYKETKRDSQLTSVESVNTLLRRCTRLRNAILSLLMTVALAGVLVVLMLLDTWLKWSMENAIWPILLMSVMFLLLGLFLFALDFKGSLQSLRNDLAD
jgi:hypothetical protein